MQISILFQARFILAKIKGEIQIENKRKVAIVEQLVKLKFDPDPVKKWKEIQKRKELEASGEVADEEESDEVNLFFYSVALFFSVSQLFLGFNSKFFEYKWRSFSPICPVSICRQWEWLI